MKFLQQGPLVNHDCACARENPVRSNESIEFVVRGKGFPPNSERRASIRQRIGRGSFCASSWESVGFDQSDKIRLPLRSKLAQVVHVQGADEVGSRREQLRLQGQIIENSFSRLHDFARKLSAPSRA